MKITPVINHSQYELNKHSVVPWKQIAYQNQTLSSEKLQALLLSLKEQKSQDNSWFYCKQIQEMPLRTLPWTVVYWGQVDKGSTIKTSL